MADKLTLRGLCAIAVTLTVIPAACGPLETPALPDGGPGGMDASVKDGTVIRDGADFDAALLDSFCKLPGSIVWSNGMPSVVPGMVLPDGGTPPDFSWLQVPDGFCVHYFATVPETRLLRFAPNGDLFVSSPSASCAGGASGGMGAIVVVPDDNHDGVGDGIVTYQSGMEQVQGLLFLNGHLYYQDATFIMRVAYNNGDRAAPPSSDQIANINVYTSPLHWPKAIDADDNGNIYVTNGGDQSDMCEPLQPESQRPFHGGILMIDSEPGGPNPNGVQVAKGLRNPIALRCAKGTGTCFALELARDFAAPEGSREKLLPVRMGDDWGFPCCATANLPYSDILPPPDCSGVAEETTSFIIDHTPFGLDFEQGYWPGTWTYRSFVALHGFFGSWVGARVVGVETGANGWPIPTAEADAGPGFTDFATGWDDGREDHGRPATVAFAPDGRLFVGNDIDGTIVWIAPVKP
jgi:glucose/arabinose dehydrogenase